MRRDFLRALEASIMGLFLVQTVRFLLATMYARVSSADLVRRVPDKEAIASLPGVVEVSTVQLEIWIIGISLLAPLLVVILKRTRWSIPLSVAVVVVGQIAIIEIEKAAVPATGITIAAALIYLALIIIRRPRFFPVMLTVAFPGDQFIRATYSTADPTFDAQFVLFQIGSLDVSVEMMLMGSAIFALILTVLTTVVERLETYQPGYEKPLPGYLGGWGAMALGGFLYLEFTSPGMPHIVAHQAEAAYHLILPWVIVATILPLVPEVRSQAGQFMATFDGAYRGWLWGLLLVLLLVIGRRFKGIPAGLILALAQFLIILTLWWMIKQPEEGKRPRYNLTPLTMLLSLAIFGLLSAGDYFTYDYAYVRSLVEPFAFVSDILRGMRQMGLMLAIVAAVLSCMPIILERQIIPWHEGRMLETLLTSLVVVVITIMATRSAVPSPPRRPFDPDCLRIVSYNIHGGYTQYFSPNMNEVADTLLRSGADIILLQEVDAGRLSSGGTDQGIWLADKLKMNVSFFPQNEASQGLAILSRMDITGEMGALLTSEGAQAAVQYVTYKVDDAGDWHVYNVWLGQEIAMRDDQPVPFEQQDQVIQMNEVYHLIASNHFGEQEPDALPERVILGGTFNFDENSPLYALWEDTVFIDPFSRLYEEKRDTIFLINAGGVRYDYIWLYNLVPSGVIIDQRDMASDHFPSVVAVGREAQKTCPEN